MHAILFIGFQVDIFGRLYRRARVRVYVCVYGVVVILIKGMRARERVKLPFDFTFYHAQFMYVLCTCYPPGSGTREPI